MKKVHCLFVLFVTLFSSVANIKAQSKKEGQVSKSPYIVKSNSRGFPLDSMHHYKGEWYFDWVYTTPYQRGNFKCSCDTMGGYSEVLFDKFVFAAPDKYTSRAAKEFQKTFIRFLMWDEKSNISKIDWQRSDWEIENKPATILEFIQEVYVTRPTWVDSCMVDFKYLCDEFKTHEMNNLPKGRIPYDAICLSHLAGYASGEMSFDTSFSIRTYYVAQDLVYLQYGYYRDQLDSVGIDILKPYLKKKNLSLGPMEFQDGEEVKVGFVEREIEYLNLSDWEVILPRLKKRLGLSS